jgi:CelD/BcsL family acetyltransferase involved in cellulose biosynthesis
MSQSTPTKILRGSMDEPLGNVLLAAARSPAGAATPSIAGGRVALAVICRQAAIGLIDEVCAGAMRSHFQSGPWLEAVADAFAGEAQPLFLAGFEGEACRILMPLAISRRHGLRRLEWLGQAVADYNLPLCDPDFFRDLSNDDVRALWREAARLAGGADVVLARKQPVTVAGVANPFAAVASDFESDRAHQRHLLRPWAEIEAEMATAKSRRRLREKFRAMEKLGDCAIRQASDPAEIRRCAEILMDWKCDQLAGTGATNPFADDNYRAFFLSICERGVAELHGIFLKGEPVALTCLLVDPDGTTLYQTGFDPSYGRYSAGRTLNATLIKHAAERGARFFDFGYGDEDYKNAICDNSVELTFSVLPLTPRGAFAALPLRAALAARRIVKRNDRLRRAALFLNRLF